MLFGDAEREYRNLKAQFEAGQLSEADFRARLEAMMIEDDQGKWWSIGYETGKWFYHDGEQWVRGDPPAEQSTTTPGSVTAAAAGALGGTPAATPAPAPAPAVASVAGSSDASAPASRAASGAQAPVGAQGRPKSILTLAIGALLVLILAAGAVVLLSRSGPTAAAPDAGSGQAGAGAPVTTVTPEISRTAVAIVAALSTASSTPADTQAPTSLPATDTATPQPPTPTDTLPPPTPTPTASPEPDTPTPEPRTPTPPPPTPTVAATATRPPAPTPTRVVAARPPAATAAPAVPGLITGFEQFGRWVRGNQPNGTFSQSTQEKHSGSASGRLDYNFPAVQDNYVVFSSRPPLPIPGTPTALNMWVLGDGSGHFLNVWVQDSQGEVRAFHFGPVPEAGTWQRLTAVLDTSAPWPQGHISGPDNGKLEYPIKLYALVLDAVPDGTASQGTIYLDDIMAVSGQ